MGSPLDPVLANLFMGHYKKEWLSNYDGVPPSYYTRYVVHDIFSVFNSHNFLILIQNTLMSNSLWKRRSTKLFLFGCPY